MAFEALHPSEFQMTLVVVDTDYFLDPYNILLLIS